MTSIHLLRTAEAIALGDNTVLSWTTKHGIKRDTAYDGIRWLRKEGLAKAVKARAGTPSAPLGVVYVAMLLLWLRWHRLVAVWAGLAGTQPVDRATHGRLVHADALSGCVGAESVDKHEPRCCGRLAGEIGPRGGEGEVELAGGHGLGGVGGVGLALQGAEFAHGGPASLDTSDASLDMREDEHIPDRAAKAIAALAERGDNLAPVRRGDNDLVVSGPHLLHGRGPEYPASGPAFVGRLHLSLLTVAASIRHRGEILACMISTCQA